MNAEPRRTRRQHVGRARRSALVAAAALLTCIAASVSALGIGASSAGWGGPRPAGAQTPPVPELDISVTVEPADGDAPITIGDRLTVVVAVTHPPELLITLRPPERVASFLVLEERPPTVTPGDEAEPAATTRFVLTATAMATGPLTPPDLEVLWIREDGSTGAMRAPLPAITVDPTLPAGATALRPLRPQAAAGTAPPRWAQAAALRASGAALAVGGVTALAVRGWRRRRRTAALRPPPVDRAPELHAIAALEQLEPIARRLAAGAGGADGGTEGRAEALELRAYYAEIAQQVRGYLAQRHGTVARALTTAELRERMPSLGIDRWQGRLVSGLLDRCDAAVYAGRYPDPASAARDLAVAFEIVQLSDPAADRAPTGAAPAAVEGAL